MDILKNTEPIKIAILAIGGDGGSVLSNWIVKTAENNGYWAQSTSIAGVAQRTGATVYYLELMPMKNLEINGYLQTPILAQMPSPFDVDIVLATEITEAGRALHRNFVSDKTTIIYSTSRNLAIKEKESAGDNILDGSTIHTLTEKVAKNCFYGNFKAIAEKNKSVISASMLGALAASKSLPFSKEHFLKIINEEGVAVKTSIAAFEESFEFIKHFDKSKAAIRSSIQKASLIAIPEKSNNKNFDELIKSIKKDFPIALHDILYNGILHLSDWQNTEWAKHYLSLVQSIYQLDSAEKKYQLTRQVAQFLAIGMAYDDLIFVADQKTRSERFEEVKKQIEAKDNDLINTLDYLHPSFAEFTGFLPVKLGKKIQENESLKRFFVKYLDSDRRMKSTNLFNFVFLYFMGGMKRWRLKTLRHYEEMENVNAWLERIQSLLPNHYDMAVWVAKTYRVKKGYGDTYARGDSKFKMLNQFAMEHQNQNGIVDAMEFLMDFALQKPSDKELATKISEIEKSFSTIN